MTDEHLKNLLSAYVAPTSDNGFSDRVMAMTASEARSSDDTRPSVDLSDFIPTRNPIKRSWVISLLLGLMAGLLWMQLGLTIPDIPEASNFAPFMDASGALYVLIGLVLLSSFVFLETDSY